MADGDRQRISIAILALGGQGGGVLADWIAGVGASNGYIAQATSVPGVAQRTGSTVYYVELHRKSADGDPILALMPQPGDVDIVLASELMETGRGILRGFVSENRTTLIGSTHRIYAISEKSAMSDGRAGGERILAAARERSRRFIGFDMDAAAERAGSIISAVMFGALAGSDALPFARESFEDVIRAGGKAVEANLAGFEAGLLAARGRVEEAAEADAPPRPTTATGEEMRREIERRLPPPAHAFAIEGVRRLMDYQDRQYAEMYLDRLDGISALDPGTDDWRMTTEAARHLALWMAYDDTIRVADLKVRGSRFERVREDVKAKPDQLVQLTEYMHPRLEEVCETMPAGIGRRILASRRLSSWLHPFFQKGRHVRTTGISWFLILSLLASLRRWRRGTLRFHLEQERIENWLELVRDAASRDPAAATELIQCQRLLKGYGDTFARGLANFSRIVSIYDQVRERPDTAAMVRRLREAALQDEEGAALGTALEEYQLAS